MKVSVKVPASIANMGPGFDVHSIAIARPCIEVTLSPASAGSRLIRVLGRYADQTSTDPKVHSGGRALETLFERFKLDGGYNLTVNVGIPPRKGLGLSGAEAAGAVLCANHLYNLRLGRRDMAVLAGFGEPSQHLDNVSASIFGGFNIVSFDPIAGSKLVTTLHPPRDLGVAVVVPNVKKASTEDTRRAIPESVSRQAYVESLGYVSRISAAFATGDVSLILSSLCWDPVIEPARASKACYGDGVDADFLHEEKLLLLRKFNVAETISGAGPSRALWYSISEDRETSRRSHQSPVRAAIDVVTERLRSLGHSVEEVFITKPTVKGASLIRKKA